MKFKKAFYCPLLIIHCSILFSQPSFPEGESSLQQTLPDKFIAQCSSGILHTLKNNPKLSKTSKSLFTKDNAKEVYALLTHIDSAYLYIEDCDYSLFKFLRLKYSEQKFSFTIHDSTDNIVNNERLREIKFDNGVETILYEDNTIFTTKFMDYTEYWECSEKFDYAPAYPYAKPIPTPLRKNYSKKNSLDLAYILSNPIFVFSLIPFYERQSDKWKGYTGQSKKTKIKSSDGKEIEGRAIDINGDKNPDAFWFVELSDKPIIEWFTRLYLNVDGEWSLVWYNYFREL